MSENKATINRDISRFTDDLCKPFPPARIKKREQKWTDKQGVEHKMYFDYVETADVIERLNVVFGSAWSFRVIRDAVHEKQIMVIAEISAYGETKQDYGAAVILPGEEGTANAYKGAASDALKRCARLFGVGLHLWSDEGGSNGHAQDKQQEPAGQRTVRNPEADATQAQIDRLKIIARRNDLNKEQKSRLNGMIEEHEREGGKKVTRGRASEIIAHYKEKDVKDDARDVIQQAGFVTSPRDNSPSNDEDLPF